MSKKYQRPESGYVGSSELLHRDKYQVDAQAEPPIPISSEKIDGDFNYVLDALNEINQAAGSYNTLSQRLDVSLNTDGTLKANAIATVEDWLTHVGAVFIQGDLLTLSGLYGSLYEVGDVIKLDNTVAIITKVEEQSEDTLMTVVAIEGNLPVTLNTLKHSAYDKDALMSSTKSLWLNTGEDTLTQRMTSALKDTRLLLTDSELKLEENTGTLETPTWNEAALFKGSSIKEGSIPASKMVAGVLGTAASKDTGISSGQIPLLNTEGKLDQTLLPATGGPVGSIAIFPTETAVPTNYLVLNGATFDEITYPELYAALGNSNQLPDWRGYFPRMSDMGRGVDSGRAVGSFQEDEFASHSHKARMPSTFRYVVNGASKIMGGDFQPAEEGMLIDPEAASHTGGTETRPKNVAVIFAIKAE